VLATLTGATLAADGLPGSLHPGGSDALSAPAMERDKIIAAALSKIARGE
jgi:hypothetical protein